MTRITLTAILLFAPASVFPLQLHPFSLSYAHSYEHPSENTTLRGKAQTGFFRSSAEFRGSGGCIPEKSELYTWSMLIKPIPGLQILAGSIALSGLPSRVKNPVNPVTSAQFRPLVVSRAHILSPGTTRATETLAGEFRGSWWNISFFSNPRNPGVPGSWLQSMITIPRALAGSTTIQAALYAGFRQHRDTHDSAWFAKEPTTNERPVVFPAAELVITNSMLSASITAMRNISRLHKDTSAICSEAAVSFRQFTVGARYFRSDSGFTEFDGSHTRIRERRLIASSLYIPLSGRKRTSAQIRVLYAVDLHSTDSLDAPAERSEWKGARLSVENTLFMVQCNAVKTPTYYRFSGKGIVYRLFVPWLRLDLSGSAELAEDQLFRLSWQKQQYRLQCTTQHSHKGKKVTMSIFGTMNQTDRFAPVHHTLGGILALRVSTAHVQQSLRIEFALPVQTGLPEAKFSLLVRLQ